MPAAGNCHASPRSRWWHDACSAFGEQTDNKTGNRTETDAKPVVQEKSGAANISIAVDNNFIASGTPVIIQDFTNELDVFLAIANDKGIAIKGKKHDGHSFVKQALKNKANYCVIAKKLKNINKNKFIRCRNTINFLNKLAVKKREHSKAKIIAVTGSSGKTTFKTLLGNLLNYYDNVVLKVLTSERIIRRINLDQPV